MYIFNYFLFVENYFKSSHFYYTITDSGGAVLFKRNLVYEILIYFNLNIEFHSIFLLVFFILLNLKVCNVQKVMPDPSYNTQNKNLYNIYTAK